MEQLLRFGEVKRGKLGVTTDDLTPDLANKLGLSGINEGALVVAIENNSPAAKAGLRKNDVVVAANGRAVRNSADVRNRIGLTPIGEEVDLKVMRGGQALQVRARIGELFSTTSLAGETIPQLAGAKIANIEPGMPMFGEVQGAILTAIENNSPAARSGLQPGDIIYGVNRQRIRNVKELLTALRTDERPLRIALLRGEYRLTLTVR
jgi:serine protease Do/serine protease DegQ